MSLRAVATAGVLGGLLLLALLLAAFLWRRGRTARKSAPSSQHTTHTRSHERYSHLRPDSGARGLSALMSKTGTHDRTGESDDTIVLAMARQHPTDSNHASISSAPQGSSLLTSAFGGAERSGSGAAPPRGDFGAQYTQDSSHTSQVRRTRSCPPP